MKRFWNPAWGNPLFLVIPFFLVILSTPIIARGIRYWLVGVAYSSRAFGAELVAESGPDLLDRCNDHADIIQKWVEKSEDNFYASVVRIAFPEFNVRDRFVEVFVALRAANDEDDATRAIAKAAEEFAKFSIDAIRLAGGPVAWPKQENLQPWLSQELENSIAESESWLERLDSEASPQIARKLCRANREAMLFAVLAYTNSQIPEEIKRLSACVSRSCEKMQNVEQEILNPTTREELKSYIKSETFRIRILDAMRHDNIDEAHALFGKAIDEAFKERGSILESDVTGTENKHTEIPP